MTWIRNFKGSRVILSRLALKKLDVNEGISKQRL